MHDSKIGILESCSALRPRALEIGRGLVFVDLFSMSYADNKNNKGMVLKLTNKAVVSYPIAP